MLMEGLSGSIRFSFYIDPDHYEHLDAASAIVRGWANLSESDRFDLFELIDVRKLKSLILLSLSGEKVVDNVVDMLWNGLIAHHDDVLPDLNLNTDLIESDYEWLEGVDMDYLMNITVQAKLDPNAENVALPTTVLGQTLEKHLCDCAA